ncbi:MAG: hypothetical protein RIB98_04730 [Acidimicrobiales bacterium]
MADTLGIHITPEGITAVRLDAVAGNPATVVQLGADGPAAVCAVAQDDGGAVLVGAAALTAPGPAVTDPLERAAAGKIGALGAVINHVVGRAAAAGGAAPRRLAIVVPDDWARPERERVVAAAAAAGITDTVTVPRSAAMTQVGDADSVIAVAAGAARVASLAAAPLVTREDLGEAVTPRAPVVLPPLDPPTGPISVFDEDEDESDADENVDPAPARSAPTAVPAAPISSSTPPTQVVPAVSSAPSPEPLRYEPPNRRISGGVIAAVVLLGLVGAIIIALVAFRGGDSSATDTDQTTTLVTTTTVATTTSETPSSTTLDPDATTSTVDPDAATTTSTTTTTTTEPPSTTTTPVPVGEPGDVTLAETGLQLVGGDLVLFGQNEATVFAALSDLLGDPDRDSGLEESAFCYGARSRFVQWGDLEVVFTEDELDSGEARFTQWYASGHDDPDGLVTFSGVGVGATVGFLEVTLGGSLQLVAAIPDDPVGLFAATNPGSGGLLNGTTTTRDPDGVVTGLWAGDSCTRIFT